MPSGPQRIICLTEETVETLYLLGQQDRIVGVSGYTCRPKEARLKPKVSAFISAKIDRILDLKPDLILGFSDLQADIARDLIRAGLNVVVFNQRSVEEILAMIAMLSRMVDAVAEGDLLLDKLKHGIEAVEQAAKQFPSRPSVYFEEWMDPLISGIRWVEELVEIAGGRPVFPELRLEQAVRNRIVTPEEVTRRNPDVIIASWCGRKVNPDHIRNRPGWDAIRAVRDGHIYEVKSTIILQPGPASLTDGLTELHRILRTVVAA
jgi:iron complex transport system substrate-binding protein